MTIPPKKLTSKPNGRCQAVMLKGIPRGAMTSQAHPLESEGKEDVDRPLTDYEKQLLREIQDLKNRQEMMVAPAPPPPMYSDSVENWQKSLETITCGRLGLF